MEHSESANKTKRDQIIKQKSYSEKRLIKLQKISFSLQAQQLRKDYNNKHQLNEMKLKTKFHKKVLTEIQEDNIGHFLKPTKIISATAHKWVIYDYYTSKYIRGYRARDSHELSVFSKLLVFCAVNTLIQKYTLDSSRFETIVTESVIKLHKNNCLLNVDDIVSLEELLHLMIMQESEVYQSILAVNIGAFLEKKRKKLYYSVFDTKDKFMKEHMRLFYELVNSYCQLLKLDNIRYIQCQPQFRKEKNKCSAYDVGILSIQCLKMPLFMEIIKKEQTTLNIKFINSQGNQVSKHLQIISKSILNKYIPYLNVCRNWEQNNFMNSHCSIFYDNKNSHMRPVVIVLLGCYGLTDRQKDIQQITEWYLKNGKKEFEQAVSSNELPQVKVTNRSSSKKNTSLKSKELIEMPKQVQKKLKIPNNEQLTKRYNEAINFKITSKSRSITQT